ncbi:MAG: HAMP domain-containing histidine kinase [Actinomycetia bacterium]|nr:HAMP domain-containing histidine kinase [Actinomycetes bacterium]
MSLRTRLVGTIAVVALVALTLAGIATYTAFSRAQLRQLDQSLERAHEPIEEVVAAGDEDLEYLVSQTAPGIFVAIQDPDGATQLLIPARVPGHESDTVALDEIDVDWPTTSPTDDRDVAVFRTVTTTSGSDELRLRIALLSDGSTLFIGQPMHEVQESQRQLLLIEIVVASGALIVAIVGGWFLVRAGLKPLRSVEQTALAIAEEGQLGHRAPGAEADTEVGRLAKALNTMLDRIDGAFEERDRVEADLRASEQRLRRFVADVSHELRTPLAAVSAYSELFERGARNHPADLDRAIHGIASETNRMNGLVEELLLLARLDEGRPLTQEPVDLAALLVEAVGTARAVAPEFPVALRVSDVVTITGDASRLRQVIDNLLANVRAHTPVGTSSAIDLHTETNEAIITVSDNGPGMEAEEAALVFERFYRVDSSRSRQTGGAGLGMSIVKAIVAAHDGTVTLNSSPGQGVVVTIRLPLSEDAS